MDHKPTRILIVEDDELIAHHLQRSLESLGYLIVGKTNRGDECIRLAGGLAPHLILMDIQLEGPLTGIQTAAEIRRLYAVPIVYLTAYSDAATIEQVKESGPYGYIVKPFTTQMLRSTIELALYHHQAEARIQSLSRFPDESPYPILRIGSDGVLLYANRSSAPLLTHWRFAVGEKIPAAWQDWLSAAFQGQTIIVELPCGGQVFSCTWTPIPGADYANLYAYDVTARHQAEQRLMMSEERLRSLVDNLPVVAYVIDQDGTFLLSEGKGLEGLGLKPGQVVGQSVYDLYGAYPDITDNVRRTLTGQRSEVTFEVAGRIFRTHFAPLVEPSGLITGVIGLSWDITEMVHMERAQRESEIRFRRLAEAGFEGLAILSEGKFLQVNPQFAAMVGAPAEELLDRRLADFVAPQFREPIDEYLRSESADTYEFLAARNSGEQFPAELQIRQIPSGGTLLQILAMRDLSQRKKTEASLRETQEKLNLVLRASRMGVWDINLDTECTHGDEEVSALLGRGRQPLEAHVQEILAVVHPEDSRFVFEKFLQAEWDIPTNLEVEFRVIWPDASIHTLAVRGNVHRIENTPINHMLGVVWDMTERHAIEEEIRRLNSDLEQRVAMRTAQMQTALRELESFSYSVSHDLRAPLRAMNGFSRLLQDDYRAQLDQQAQHYIQRICDSSRQMSDLIDNLLNLSRYTRAMLNVTALNLSEIVAEIAAGLTQQDPARQVTWNIAAGVNARGDEQLIRVVLNNLLNNAWKFTSRTSQARIEFGVDSQPERQVFFIRDNGAGFNMEYLGKLFGAFQRLHGTSEFEGSGIGLATVQRIIRRHGGEVWAEGEVGRGATFSFTLP